MMFLLQVYYFINKAIITRNTPNAAPALALIKQIISTFLDTLSNIFTSTYIKKKTVTVNLVGFPTCCCALMLHVVVASYFLTFRNCQNTFRCTFPTFPLLRVRECASVCRVYESHSIFVCREVGRLPTVG